MHEADAARPRLLEQHEGAEHVRVDDVDRAENGAVDVRLGGEVDDRVGALRRVGHSLRVADVPDDQLDARALEVGRVPRVRQLVQHDDVFARGAEPFREV